MKNNVVFLPIMLFACILLSLSGFAQSGKDMLKSKQSTNTDFYSFAEFSPGKELPAEKFTAWLSVQVDQPKAFSLKLVQEWTDKIGIKHFRYQQYFNDAKIDRGMIIAHTRNGKVLSFNGNLFRHAGNEAGFVLSPTKAISQALEYVNAEIYKWEVPAAEQLLKNETGNNLSTYYPVPEKILYPVSSSEFRPAYRIDVYSQKPYNRQDVYVDAETGKVLEARQHLLFTDVPGTAVTKYSGTQTITTDSYSGSYRLRETGRGNGIETWDMNMLTDYGAAVDFTDTDNNWNNVNAEQDEVATDAHWATEKTYDFYYLEHGWNSIDNNGLALRSYVHFNLVDYGYPSNVNAFWDGQRMTYGDGGGGYTPLTTVDITGHEITHGLTEFSAGLIYQDESGALNEGFSDIFGTTIEFYAKPALANWLIGEDIGSPFRSMENPNDYNDPDCYHGDDWYTGTADNGGVHTNSMVICYWYYLISEGGSGTNELGSTFSVSAIGIDKAADIAFRLLTTYLTPDATYADARFYAIQSAIDLYGPCSPEVEAVTNAWYACGVGSPYVPYVVANFDAPLHVSCSAPLTVSFQNTSINASVFNWNFGDGGTSTLASPSHTYNSVGEYTVVLYASGGTCGSDTITLTDYVSISPANPCVVYLPVTGTAATQTACNGKLYDSGGPTGNYQDNVDAVITIAPPGATDVTIGFVEFNIEPGSGSTCDYDYIEIFDGPNTSSPSLGEFCNTNGSPGTVTSSGGAITILLHSDGGLNLSGFELDWTCNLSMVAPVSDFVFNTPNCTGTVNFSDESINGPANWVWAFGDGSTSTQQNPVHTYAQSGTYDVTLITSNPYGSDTLTIAGAITVVRPDSPVVDEDTVCTGQPAVLTASASGLVRWFATPSGTIWIGTGNSYTTPILSTTTTYYAENFEAAISQYVGPTNNTSNGDYFTSSNIHYLEFDCFSACRIVSVSVNASTSGVRTIVLINSAGDTIDQISVNIPAGVSRVNVNLDVPAGNDFRLAGPASPNLFRSNGGLSYPYNLGGYISITNSSASANPTGYYYFFYDWEVKGPDCISDRVPVDAVVEICTGNETTLEYQADIYPNPSQGIFYISNSSITNWEITDIRGQVIAADVSTGSDGTIIIDLAGLAPGVYILRGTNEDNSIIRKLVVE